jgi:hypothetical protein
MAAAVGGSLFALFTAPLLAVAGALGAGMTTFVGAIYPDVDHHNSVPRRKAARAFGVLVWLGVVSLAVLSWDALVTIVETGFVEPSESATAEFFDAEVDFPPALVASAFTFLAAVGLAGLVNPAIGFVTRSHRAWTHSVPVNVLLTGVIAAAVWLLTGGLGIERRVVAVTVVVTFFVGILIHLGLDGEIV